MKPIICLNSGGFDSTVLLHKVVEENPDIKVYSLFFDYGQLSVEQERRCAKNNASKLKAEHIEIVLPKITWSSNSFYDPNLNESQGQYLEMRNLIFFSYALSFAQSKEAGSIYSAILKSHYGYNDTSEQFVEDLNTLSKNAIKVKIVTPFRDYDKYGLTSLAFKYDLISSDYHSCDTPTNGEPCGKCNDCIVLKHIEDYIKKDNPHKIFISNGYNVEDIDFRNTVNNYPVQEMRVLTNNLCQLRCNHCFYGFEEMTDPILTLREFKEVIKQAVDLGITNFHFSGKEPLCDGIIFDLAIYLKRFEGITYDLVTNGILLPKYYNRICKANFSRIFVSIDSLDDITPKGYGHTVKLDYLKCLKDSKIPITVFIDLHKDNVNKVNLIIKMLYHNYGIKSFHVRTVINVPHKKIDYLSLGNIETIYNSLFRVAVDYEDVNIELRISRYYSYNILEKGSYELKSKIGVLELNSYRLNNFTVFTELFCCKYLGNITLTPDGYILGCGVEVSNADYSKISAGSVRENSLKSLIERGKNINIEGNIQVKNIYDNCPKYIDI